MGQAQLSTGTRRCKEIRKMNLRDLTDEQIKAIQSDCLESYEHWKKRRKAQHLGTPEQKEVWKNAFSDGVKSALSLIEKNEPR